MITKILPLAASKTQENAAFLACEKLSEELKGLRLGFGGRVSVEPKEF